MHLHRWQPPNPPSPRLCALSLRSRPSLHRAVVSSVGSKACSAAAHLLRHLKSRKTRSPPAKAVVVSAASVVNVAKAAAVTVNAVAVVATVVSVAVNVVKAVAVMVRVATKAHVIQLVMVNATPRAPKAARPKATTNAAVAAAMAKAVAVSATAVLKAKPTHKPMT